MKQQSNFNFASPFAWIDIPNKPYSISKYPITNTQYAPFVEAGGYTQRQWWTDAGWDAKVQGLAFDYSKGGAVATNEPWIEPRYWRGSQWNGAEYPVVGVTWYEALAYCRWLSDQTSEKIMLPTEDQWQYAA